ncbi:MAG: hypothetical protein K2Q22_02095, partial [Cytophagales bacterium]|nr:hypothetical protein [Cytophagales bacterium]
MTGLVFAQPENIKLNKVPPTSPIFQGSNYIDIYPVVSPDGHMILFTRAGHPDNYGGVNDPGDIW